MSPASPRLESRTLAFLSALFILTYFILFSYSSLFAYFTFDDGTAVVANLGHFETPWWRNLLHILTVFTPAYRPLATVFWRPLYAIFGYHPMPYRIAIHLMLAANIVIVYVMARRLELARDAALLTVLFFCYNGAMNDLYYDSCTVTDVMCFLFYTLAIALYLHARQAGKLLSLRRAATVVVCYLLALDSKELAVALPGVLTIYEVLYHHKDFLDKEKRKRLGGLLALMFVVGAIYLKVKVADMSQNPDYHPHVTLPFVLKNVAVYLCELLYLPEKSISPLGACLLIAGLIAIGALLRSRPAIFGTLFFVTALIPVAVILPRGAYCAYIAYFGLTLTAGAILASVRTHFVRMTNLTHLDTRTAVIWFVLIAALLCKYQTVRWNWSNQYFQWITPQVTGLYDNFQRTIPEFPPAARVLIAEDPWQGDWGPMFLLELQYHDKTLWVDWPKNMGHPPDLASYDLVVSYTPGYVNLMPARLFGLIPLNWKVRGSTDNLGRFVYSSPAAHGAVSRVDFSPQAVRSYQSTTVTVPGLSSVPINVVYRMVSDKRSIRRMVVNWCTLDDKGTCTITAPATEGHLGAMIVDWIQAPNQRWIFTGGVLTIVE